VKGGFGFPWRAREREPITGAPSGGPGGRAPGGGQRAPSEADSFFKNIRLEEWPNWFHFMCLGENCKEAFS